MGGEQLKLYYSDCTVSLYTDTKLSSAHTSNSSRQQITCHFLWVDSELILAAVSETTATSVSDLKLSGKLISHHTDDLISCSCQNYHVYRSCLIDIWYSKTPPVLMALLSCEHVELATALCSWGNPEFSTILVPSVGFLKWILEYRWKSPVSKTSLWFLPVLFAKIILKDKHHFVTLKCDFYL